MVDGVEHSCEWPIEKVLDLGLLVVVMFDPDAEQRKSGQFRNVVACRRDGSGFWIADVRTTETGDRFTAVRWPGCPWLTTNETGNAAARGAAHRSAATPILGPCLAPR